MIQKLSQQEEAEQLGLRTYTQFIEQVREEGGNEVRQTIKQVKRTIQVRQEVLDRQKWDKWGDLSSFNRGQHREGDMLIEQELKMQTVDGRKNDEINFVIPAPKVFFKVDLNKYDATVPQEEYKQQTKSEVTQGVKTQRMAGEQIMFPSQGSSYSNNWLLIISNIVYFEQAETFEEVIEMKDRFRDYIQRVLKMDDQKDNYFISFLQNKRKNKLVAKNKSKDQREQAIFPLLQKVMLRFSDKGKAMQAEEKLNGQSFIDCILEVELQEQKQR